MTLNFKLHSVTKIGADKTEHPFANEVFTLVTGSQCGELLSQGGKNGKWLEPFCINSSANVFLQFKFYQDMKLKEFLGEGSINTKTFVKKRENKIERGVENPFELSIEKNGQSIGLAKLSFTYEKVKQYEGEIGSKRQLQFVYTRRNNLQFYKGGCPTNNLFSCLDTTARKHQFKWLEPTYHDDNA